MSRNDKLNRLAMLLVVFVSSTASAFQSGNGTEQYPYQVSTPQDILDINNDLSASYILINHIDLAPSTTGMAPFTTAPIACDTANSYNFFGTAFTGTFDGNGYEILNLTIDTLSDGNTDNDSNSWLALFGKLEEGAVLKHLTLRDCSITGGPSSRYISTMCGQNYKAVIDRCLSTGTVDGGSQSIYLGGFCAWNDDEGTIINCRSEVDVTGDRIMGGFCAKSENALTSGCSATGDIACSLGSSVPDYVGGFCGMNFASTIKNSHSSVNILCTSKAYYVGGFCGYNGYENSGTTSFIYNCYSSGNITTGQSSYYLGGFCGYNGNQSTITNSYARGNVHGGNSSRFIGGFCGYNYAGIISFAYSTGSPSGETGADEIGGFCGYDIFDTISTNCFWDMNTSFQSTSDGGMAKTTTEMKDVDTFLAAEWDFVNEADNGHMDIWFMPIDGYPKLWWQTIPADINCDMTVDLLDLPLFTTYWLQNSSQLLPGYRLLGDINFDDNTDLLDFAILAENWLNVASN